MPGYTCVMVPGPVLYLGATPVYVDIEPDFYTVPAAAVAAKITSRTKAIWYSTRTVSRRRLRRSGDRESARRPGD